MKSYQRRRGSVFIELPVALFILGLLGLTVVAAVRLLCGPIAWYWWPVGFFGIGVVGQVRRIA